MTTTINPPDVEQRVVLRDVSWGLYQQLLVEHEDASTPRFTYDRGTLEIAVPSFNHEQVNRTLARLFETVAEEMEIDYINAGSTTFDRKDLLQGVEPDTCFYVQHVERVRGKRRLNLAADPPPDLVIEVDVTHPSVNKFSIFANLGITEVWVYRKERLIFFKLDGGEYRETAESLTLRGVTSDALTDLLAASGEQRRTDWLRSVRSYARGVQANDAPPAA